MQSELLPVIDIFFLGTNKEQRENKLNISVCVRGEIPNSSKCHKDTN